MRNADTTREKLIAAATEAFWRQGYSNVSLRAVAKAASVDVALISRYFGGKLGLFQATLETAFDWPEMLAADDPVQVAIAKYANPDTDAQQVSSTRMIVVNASDPEVGDLVRQTLRDELIGPMQDKMGGPEAAPHLAMFVAVILGASMVRQTLRLPGMADQTPCGYAAQLQHLIDAALTFEPHGADQNMRDSAAT